MIVNAHITAWHKRTGSDQRGQATFEAQTLSAPPSACRSAVTARQAELLATRGLTADAQLIYRLDRAGAPDVRAGDRVQVDNLAWWLVVSVGATVKGAVSHRLLILKGVN